MAEMTEEKDHLQPARRLSYDFLSLAWVSRWKVAKEVGLLEDGDKGLSDDELWPTVFRRAKERTKLEALWAKVCPSRPNPFVGQ